ncbi:phosphotransferase [Candidatus Parcubacteria bacterium]|nr:phosphotransferase [Candidatus Parcubacteria bacterium]
MTERSVVPTVEELREYLERRKPLGWEWDPVSVRPLNAKPEANHWTFAVAVRDHARFDHEIVIRAINPSGMVRRSRWLTLRQEYRLLRCLNRYASVAPETHHRDLGGFRMPLLFQELIPGESLTALAERGKLEAGHLFAAVDLVSRLGACPVQLSVFPWLWVRRERSYRQHAQKCYARLADIAAATTNSGFPERLAELSQWYDQLSAIVEPVAQLLDQCQSFLDRAPSVLIFKGAHLGNTIWEPRMRRCRFVDWESVAWGDPVYTFVRPISAVRDLDRMPGVTTEGLVTEFESACACRPLRIGGIRELVRARLLERALSDAVWVVWEYVVRHKTGPINETTGIAR